MFEAPQSIPTLRSSLLAASSKYGLTFVGCPTGNSFVLKLANSLHFIFK